MIHKIQTELINSTQGTNLDFVYKILLYNDFSKEYLPIPVFLYVRPNFTTQLILNILVSLGRFRT